MAALTDVTLVESPDGRTVDVTALYAASDQNGRRAVAGLAIDHVRRRFPNAFVLREANLGSSAAGRYRARQVLAPGRPRAVRMVPILFDGEGHWSPAGDVATAVGWLGDRPLAPYIEWFVAPIAGYCLLYCSSGQATLDQIAQLLAGSPSAASLERNLLERGMLVRPRLEGDGLAAKSQRIDVCRELVTDWLALQA